MVDIRPELFAHKGRSIHTDINAPFLGCVAEGTFACGIVEIRYASGCAGADDFATVEGCSSSIGPGDDDAAECIAGSLKETAFVQRLIPDVFMRKCRHD